MFRPVPGERGTFTPGALTGVLAAAAFGYGRWSYVPLHVGAVVERRDEAEEAKRFSQQGLRNSRASLSAGFFFGIRASKQVVAGGWPG